jgi:O-antigen/teichoic acid export membrane protein
VTQPPAQLELKRFAIDNVIVLIRLIFSIVIAFGLATILARGLGSSGKGIYELTIYLPSLMVNVIFNFGLPLSISYHVARGNFSFDEAVSSNGFLNIVMSLMGIALAVGIIFWKGAIWFSSVPTTLLYGGLILIPMMMSLRNTMAVFGGMQDFRTAGIIEVLPHAASLILYLILIIVLDFTVMHALIATIVGYGIATLTVVLILMRRTKTKHPVIQLPRLNYLKSLFSYGLQIYGSIIIGSLLLRIDVLLLNTLGQGVASVGLYSIAVALVERIWTISSFTSRVLMPRLASWKDDKERQAQLTLLSMKYSFWFSILIAIGLIVFGRPVIIFVFGAEFAQSYNGILALLPGVIFYNFVYSIGAIMLGSGHIIRSVRYVSIALVLNLILNLILIPRYDFVGAGVASSIAYTLYGLMMLWDFQRYYHVKLGVILRITDDDIRRFQSLWKLIKDKAVSIFPHKQL